MAVPKACLQRVFSLTLACFRFLWRSDGYCEWFAYVVHPNGFACEGNKIEWAICSKLNIQRKQWLTSPTRISSTGGGGCCHTIGCQTLRSFSCIWYSWRKGNEFFFRKKNHENYELGNLTGFFFLWPWLKHRHLALNSVSLGTAKAIYWTENNLELFVFQLWRSNKL